MTFYLIKFLQDYNLFRLYHRFTVGFKRFFLNVIYIGESFYGDLMMEFKPSAEELKWAKQLELDLKKRLMEDLSDEEKQELRELHWKKCPKDGIDLIEIKINTGDIVVYKCVMCGGVWFDRIILEKLFQYPEGIKNFLELLSKSLGIEITRYKD